MAFQTYERKASGRRKPELVQALQVIRPYRKVTFALPRSRQVNKPSGALDYLRVIDAPEGNNRAKEGDWVVKFSDGRIEVVTAKEFNNQYTDATGAEESEIGVQAGDPGEELD